jgi:hypothetical protein
LLLPTQRGDQTREQEHSSTSLPRRLAQEDLVHSGTSSKGLQYLQV